MKNSSLKGISIIEIVIASGIIAVSVVGIVAAIQIYIKIVYQNTRESQTVLLLDETAEALQYLRDKSYQTNIADSLVNVPYTVFWDGTKYQITTSPTLLQYDMTRTVVFKNVYRNGSDQIVENGSGVLDTNTKKAVIEITWPYKNETKVLSSELLLHNIYEN